MGVQVVADLPGLFLLFQLSGAVVPVANLGGKTFAHGLFRLVNHDFAAFAHVFQMFGDKMAQGIADGRIFHAARQPRLLAGVGKNGVQLFRRGGAVVEVRRIACVCGCAVFVHLHKMDIARDDAAATIGHGSAVLNSVLNVEEQAHGLAGIAVVDKDGAAFKQIARAFADGVDHGFKQRMPGTDERGRYRAGQIAIGLVEADALVAVEHRLDMTYLPVPIADGEGNGEYLPTTFLTGRHATAQFAERFLEERLYEIRLEAAGLHALHFLADDADRADVHHVFGKGAFLQQLKQCLRVEGNIHVVIESGLHVGVTAVAHGFDKQFA